MASLIVAVDSLESAGRVLDLNIIGATQPIACVTERIATVSLFLAGAIQLSRISLLRWNNILVTAGALAAIVLLLEGAVRVKTIISPQTTGFPTYSSAIWRRYYVQLNELGYRDNTPSGNASKGKRRLVVVGDSYAFGWSINDTKNRFGEQLAELLSDRSEQSWVSINLSRQDTHTLHHIELLKDAVPVDADLIILLYVFNDMDYLAPVTRRSSLNRRTNPIGIAYRNSYLFQEVYLRIKLLQRQFGLGEAVTDPYADNELLIRHFQDLAAFVELAENTGAMVGIVPFDISVTYSQEMEDHYKRFTELAESVGLPIWAIGSHFDGHNFSQLTANRLDAHPNEIAHRIAAREVAEKILPHFKQD